MTLSSQLDGLLCANNRHCGKRMKLAAIPDSTALMLHCFVFSLSHQINL